MELSNPYASTVRVILMGGDVIEIAAFSTVSTPGDCVVLGVAFIEGVDNEASGQALQDALLTQEQRSQLAEHNYIEVQSRLRFGVTYRVPRSYGSVNLYRRNQCIASACLVPEDILPASDLLPLRLLLLEGAEKDFLHQASISIRYRSRGRGRAGLEWISFYQQAKG